MYIKEGFVCIYIQYTNFKNIFNIIFFHVSTVKPLSFEISMILQQNIIQKIGLKLSINTSISVFELSQWETEV